MNKEQLLLLKLAEECSELSKACSKAIRFGVNATKPGSTETNRQRIIEEFKDVAAAIDYLIFDQLLPIEEAEMDYEFDKRRERIDKYLQVSKDLGIYKE